MQLYEKSVKLQKLVNSKLKENDDLRIRVNSLVSHITPLYAGLRRSWDKMSPDLQEMYENMEKHDPIIDEVEQELDRLTAQLDGKSKEKTLFDVK